MKKRKNATKKSLGNLLLKALEPPHKNPYYFKWKLNTKNRNNMLLFTLASAVAMWLSPEAPSPWRGLLGISTGATALGAGFLLKYSFLKMRDLKFSAKLYEVLMDHDEGSDEGGSFMFLVMICQAFFAGFTAFGFFVLIADLLALK